MDKQYSVKFFTSLVESMQKVCRDYLDFEQAVDLSGYLCVEIDNFKKERYVLSELIQNTGDVISESYCTKAFKTLRKPPRESSGLENNDPKQTLMTSVESSHAVGSGLNRMSSRRSDSSSSRVGHNTSHIDSKWNISPRSPYSSSSAAARKRNIPQSSVSSLKRDRGDSYRGAVESEPYSSVIPTNTNAYLTESVSESATQTLSVPSNSAGSSFSMTLPSASMPHSSATQSVSNTGETIRLPLNVTVKEEDDISFMVLDDTEDFDNSVTYGDNDTSNSFVHTQTNEKLMSASPNAGDQENAHTARKMKGHVKLFQVSTELQSLSLPDTLPDHRQTVQPLMLPNEGQPIDRFECRKCHYVFGDRGQHKQHMQTYHPDTFGCDICGRNFDYKRSLWEHMQNHKGKKKFPCPYKDCDKSFTRKAHMMDHVNAHSGLKPYSCNRCHKQFRGKYTLIGHVKHCMKGLNE